MHQRTVSVRIRSDGSCTIDAHHFPDAGCHEATSQILDALSATTTREIDKPEARIVQRDDTRQRESSR